MFLKKCLTSNVCDVANDQAFSVKHWIWFAKKCWTFWPRQLPGKQNSLSNGSGNFSKTFYALSRKKCLKNNVCDVDRLAMSKNTACQTISKHCITNTVCLYLSSSIWWRGQTVKQRLLAKYQIFDKQCLITWPAPNGSKMCEIEKTKLTTVRLHFTLLLISLKNCQQNLSPFVFFF